MQAEVFGRRFNTLILLAWMVPAVFGLSYILYIQLLSVDQMVLVMTRPLEPAFILASNLFAFWYFRRYSQPMLAWLTDPRGVDPEQVQKRLHAFPLHFWFHFLLYLLVAPSTVIISAEIYSDFVARPVDWFRIHLVALVVAIIVGLPIFFRLLDLFGEAFGRLALSRPQVSLKAKVFLIGALTPLLIDTMIVQYYWTRTGFFSFETFVIWLGLEIIAVLGALMFMGSIAQSLRPLERMVDSLDAGATGHLARLQPESTDELGLLAGRFMDLLKEREANAAVSRLSGQLLRAEPRSASLGVFIESLIGLVSEVLPGDQAFLHLFDAEQQELVVVAMSGGGFKPAGHFRISLDKPSLAGWAFRQGQTVALEDVRGDARVHQDMLAAFPAHSLIVTPLWAGSEVIGTLASASMAGPVSYGPRDVEIFEGIAREAALALHAFQLQEAQKLVDQAQRRQQELIELLTDSASEGIYTVNTEGYCTFVNPAALRLLGYEKKEDLLGRNIHALIHHTYPDGRPYPKVACHVRLSTQEGQSTHVDDEVHWRADGTSFPVEYWSHPMYQDGELVGAVVTFVDISERKETEQALRDNEERYRLISNVTSDVLYSCARGESGHFEIDWAAGTVEKVFGLTVEELLARRCWRCLVHPDDLPLFDRHITELKPGESSDFELRILRPDGELRHVRAYSRVMADDLDAQRHRLFGACQDITDQREVEARILESEARYRTLTGNIPGAVYRCEVESPWRITLISEGVEALTGYPAEAFLKEGGMAWADLIVTEDLPALDAIVAAGVRNRTVYRATYRIRHRNGEVHHVYEQGRAVYDERGRPVWLDGVIQDVTERHKAEEALRESEARFRAMADNSADWIWFLDTRGRHTYSNDRVTALLGYGVQDFLALNVPALVHPEDLGLFSTTFQQAIARKEGWHNVVLRWRRSNGSYITLESSATPVFDTDGNLVGFQGADRDVTERLRAEAAVRESERRYRALFDASGEGIFILHGDRYVDCNAAALHTLGCTREQVVGETPLRFSPELQPDGYPSRARAEARIEAAYRGETQVFEWRHLRYDGTIFDAEVSLSRVDLEGEPHLLAAMRDISERKQAEERIQFMAHHDALTGLPNRILLRDRFHQSQGFSERAGSKVALLFMDLDNFKVVNDTLGHAAGDQLLLAVVDKLTESIRETDTVSRQGGDEFIILLNGIQEMETVERIAGDILRRMMEPVSIEGHVLHTSGSIGIALYPQDGEDFDTLLLKADTAMYNAKEAGRNTYRFFDEQMNAQALEHLLLQNRLRQALDRNEFHLHFQPQLDLSSGRIFGAEALLRWNSPDLGPVPPSRFIPVAEDSGLVVPIGVWVLDEACRQAAAWQQADLPEISISVNISAVQFRRPNLVEVVSEALAKSGLKPHLLELELTESLLLHDMGRNLEMVQRLKALGVRLAIDDFGTGYSSLSYLKRFAVDKLKIDQSFVRDISTDPDDAAIVRAIIQLATSLRLGIIAEGVETEVQKEFLRLEGCREVQGYLIGYPMSAADLMARLDSQAQ